jgi:predicted nucleic acid-binding protein
VTRAAVDTSALLALASSRDQYHRRAISAEAKFRRKGGQWVGTTLVLAELHGHLIRRLDPRAARRIISAVMADPAFEWFDATVDLLRAATERWISGYSDQRFSLTDAVTFELMRRERIANAFAFDQHFVVAGYSLLG